MKVYLIIGNNIDLKNYVFSVDSIKVGIDKGSILALENGLDLDYAVGDFDSCSDAEISKIHAKVQRIIELNPIKDDTDTKHAYSLWKDEKDVSFVLLGGIQGRRIEHFYANLELVMQDKRVSVEDDDTLIKMIDDEMILNDRSYKYISFFPIENGGRLTLKGFAYDLDNHLILKGEGLAISNELKKKEGYIKVNDGRFLMFLSKNDKTDCK